MVRHILWAGIGALAIVPALRAQVDTSAQPAIPVYLEDSPAAQELVDRALHLRDQGRLVDASAVMQQVIDQFPQKLMRVAGPQHEDAARWVRRTIRGHGDWLEAYRRTYEPEAARLLALAHGDGPDAAALAQIVHRFSLCPSGLQASLQLTGLWLERGAVDDAATLLDAAADHPDLPAHALQYHQLRAAQAAIAGDATAFDAARAELDRIQAGSTIDDLDALAGAMAARGADAPAQPADLPESFDAPLWQVPLVEAPSADNALLLRRLPTLTDRMVLVNTGMMVMAIDRASGRELWSSGDVVSGGPDIQAGRFFSAQRLLPDERGVAVWGDRVMAVLGPDMAQMGRRQWWQPATYLSALARDDGRTLWQRQPSDLDASLDNAFFHGTPIAGYDRVFVLLRRSQISGFNDAFVAAVDAATGQLLWRRHLSSAASGHRFAARPLAQMTVSRGRLFISDNLGVVTCIDGHSGAVIWSCLLGEAVPGATGAPLRGAAESPLNAPLVVGAGVIVPPWGAGSPALLLHTDTGEVIQELATPPWSQATLLAQAGDDVLAVGANVACFDGRTLELRWVHEGDEPPVARPVTVGSMVLVPRRQRVTALDMATGRLQADIRCAAAVALAIDDGQVIVTTNRSVSSYMPWSRAYANLTRRMKADLGDASSGVALAHVAASLGKPEAVLEGVDHAVAALRRMAQADDASEPGAQQARRAVFEQLLTFTDGQRVADADLRRQLFQRLGSAATTAADEVAYRLGLAAFEAQSGPVEVAVDHYQSILLDDTLAAELYAHHGTVRQAWMEARRQLTALAEQHGQAIYARHDAAANVRLQEIITTRASDPQLLEDLARRYPLSPAAVQALLAAADALAARGDLDAALPLLRQAYRQAPAIDLAARAVGRLAELSVQLGRPRIARHWLERAARQHPGIRPLRDGLPLPIDRWLAQLASMDAGGGELGALQLPFGPAAVLDGRLLRPAPGAPAVGPSDRIALQRDATLELRQGPDLQRRWAVNLAVEQPLQLLWHDEEQITLWSPQTGQIIALDAGTGRRLRDDLDSAQLIQSVGDHRLRTPTPQQQQVRDLIDQPIIVRQGGVIRLMDPAAAMLSEGGPITRAATNEWVIVLADELGRVVCIDRRTGHTLWRLLAPMQRISSLHLDEDSLVVAGITDPGTDAQGGIVMVLDPGTGERRCPPLEVRDLLTFVAVGESLVVYATASEVAAHHVADGAVAWRLPADDRVFSGQGWLDGDSLVLVETGPTPGLLMIDVAHGKIVRRLVGGDLGLTDTIDMRKAARFWHLRAARMVAALDDAGAMAWRDAVALDGERFIHQVVARDQVVAIATSDPTPAVAAQPQIMPGGDQRVLNLQLQLRLRAAQLEIIGDAPTPDALSRRYSLYVFERQGGRLIADYQLGPLPAALDLAPAMLLDNRIALPCGPHTIILPGAATPRTPH